MTIPRRAVRLQILGVILLLAGVGAGGLLYWRAVRADADPGDEILRAQEQSRAYQLAMEKNVGRVGLMLSQLSERLGEPRAVAVEVALAGGVAAGVCFALAARPPRE